MKISALPKTLRFNPQPTHALIQQEKYPPRSPNPPPAVLARSYARCGINQRMPLQAAAEVVFKPLLRKYKALLPRTRWRAVCMQTMRSTQAFVGSLQGAPEPPKTPQAEQSVDSMHGGGSKTEDSTCTKPAEHACTNSQEMSWEDLNAGVLAAEQLLLCMLCEASREQDSNAVVCFAFLPHQHSTLRHPKPCTGT